MSYTRCFLNFILFAIFLLRTSYGQQSTCLPLYGTDANHPNGLFIKVVPLKQYTGPKQNTASTYIAPVGQGGQILWDPIQGPQGVGGQTLSSAISAERSACIPTPVNPPPPPPQPVPFTSTPLAVASHILVASDFNRDGFADEAVVVPGSSQVSIYLGKPDGTFQDPALVKLGNASTKLVSIAVADFNGDKKTDIVAVDSANNAVYLLLGKGDGTFSPPVTIAVGHSPSGLTVTDVNSDGFPDIVVTNSADGSVSVLRGLGDGTFIPPLVFAVGKNPVSVIAQDLNHDGNIDLVVADNGSNDLAVLLGNGNGSFQNATFTKTPSPPTYLASADFNNDGQPDVVALSGPLNTVMMFTGSAQGKLTLAGSFLVPNLSASFAVNDFDSDGNLDLLIPDTDTGNLVLLLGRGDGTLIAPPAYAGSNGLTTLTAADLNNDGKPDLIMTGANSATSTLSLFPGLGNGQFGNPVNIPVPGRTEVVGVGDFNQDGRVDIAVSGAQLNILLNQPNGTFRQGAQYPNLVPSIVADFNKDGRPDLAGPFNGAAGLMLGVGDGTFRPATSIPAGSHPTTAVAADFNGDKSLDMAVLDAGTPGSDADRGGVTVLLGNGTGSFPNVVNVAAGFNPRAIAVGDVNGDGKPDLVVATGVDTASSSFQISVFLGKGDGTFLAPSAVPVPAGETPVSLAIVDLDGDGYPDIVLGDCCVDATTAYYRGNGDGTFEPVTPFYGGNDVRAIAVGDWNGDGKPDLALAYSPSTAPAAGAIVPLTNHLSNVQVLTSTSGASFLAGPMAPNSIVSAFGNTLTTGTAAATGDPASLPTALAGTTVTIQDSQGTLRQAQLYYVSPTQINYLVPSATALGKANVIVTAPNGVTVGPAQVIATAPGMFMANSNGLAAGSGVHVSGIIQSSFNLSYLDPSGTPQALPISLGTRLDQNFLSLYGTGFRNRNSLDVVSISVNGMYTPALYAGPQSQYPGLDQLNFQLPQSLAGTGLVNIQVTVNGVNANPVFVVVQ